MGSESVQTDIYIFISAVDLLDVADGAGSAKFSRKGSEIACETVVDYCKAQLQNCVEFEDKIRAYKNSENEEEARKQMANIIYSIIGNAAFKAHKNIKDAAASAGSKSIMLCMKKRITFSIAGSLKCPSME